MRTCEMCFRRIGFRQGVVTPEGKRVCASCARKTAEGTTFYKPFCSLACNREYSSMVAAPDTTNNTEPYCLNCGKPTEEMPKRARKVAHDAGAPQEVRHCPFCGSGDVVGRSDGSVECGYCNQVCTIKVEPQYPNMPQTDPVTGQPMMPQDPAKPPSAAPGAPPAPGGKPPFPPKKDGPPPPGGDKPKGDNPFPPKKDDSGDKPDDGKKKPPPFGKQQSRRRVAAGKSFCGECGRPITYIAPPADEGPDARGDWVHDDEYQVWGTANEYDHVAVPAQVQAARRPGGTFITAEGIAVDEDSFVDDLARRFGRG